MIDLNVHKKFRYVLFSGLYAAEGLYQTILLLVTPLYLLEKNVSIPIITLVMAIGELPWALKFIWGGIIDFYQEKIHNFWNNTWSFWFSNSGNT